MSRLGVRRARPSSCEPGARSASRGLVVPRRRAVNAGKAHASASADVATSGAKNCSRTRKALGCSGGRKGFELVQLNEDAGSSSWRRENENLRDARFQFKFLDEDFDLQCVDRELLLDLVKPYAGLGDVALLAEIEEQAASYDHKAPRKSEDTTPASPCHML